MIISHGIWWLLRIQSCTHEKEESLLLLNLFRSHVRNCQSASQSHLKPNKRGHLSKLLIIDTADPEKKETQPLDCFQFVKVGASFYISPFPFSPYTLFLNWIYLGVLVVVHCILAHPSLELVIKHRRSYNCNNARVNVSHSGFLNHQNLNIK